MKIPFTDLRAMHDEVREDIEARWRLLVDGSAFVGGPAVQEFEQAFATYCEVPHAIGVGSGTDALRIALQAVGVRPGDLVLTVPNTFIATVEAISQAGASPVFVDVQPDIYTMDPVLAAKYLEGECLRQGGALVERASGRRVSAMVPVDLYGHPADWEALIEVARKYGLKVVEDACQAHGARYKGQRCGTFGDAAAFSFYPGKNLGAMGEAGAITTADATVAEQCRILRDHGQRERYIHVTGEGGNGRLDAIQAAVLTVKLRRLDSWNEARRRAAEWYASSLARLDVTTPRELPSARHVYHLYVILLPNRDSVRRQLEQVGVQTGLHYPVPLHLQEAYRALGHARGDFPISEHVAGSALSLPIFPHMEEEQVSGVVGALEAALRRELTGSGEGSQGAKL